MPGNGSEWSAEGEAAGFFIKVRCREATDDRQQGVKRGGSSIWQRPATTGRSPSKTGCRKAATRGGKRLSRPYERIATIFAWVRSATVVTPVRQPAYLNRRATARAGTPAAFVDARSIGLTPPAAAWQF